VRALFQRRSEYGATNALLQELTADDAQMSNRPNPYSFNNYTIIDVATYNTLFGMIEPKIRGSSYFRHPVSANEKFAVTLRYLATGKQQSLPCTFQVFLILRMYVSMNSGVAKGDIGACPPVVVRVKFLRAVDLDLLLLAMTLYWNSGLHGLLREYELHAVIW